MKDFRQDFFMLYDKIRAGEHFAFSRFSDGEMYVMQGTELQLAGNHYKIGSRMFPGAYFPEDHKHIDPVKHSFVGQKLMEAYCYKKHNYFKGISCRCCVGEANFNQMIDWHEGDQQYLTWSNLWVNGNYQHFRQYIVPEFANRKIVYILNENANLSGLPFQVVKDFRIGENCIVNEFDRHKEVAEWIEKEQISDHIFIFSASSLSNIMIYELFKRYDNNTYIDIGTTLNAELGMKGVRLYLMGANEKICIW